MSEVFAETSAGRRLSLRPLAILVFVVSKDEDEDERILLMNSPRLPGVWQVINGAVEAGETLLRAAYRETAEEAGPDVKIRPLGLVHAFSFPHDEDIPTMISACYVAASEGGDVVPGDDMAGSEFGWFSLDEIEGMDLLPRHPWIFSRAVELFRLWRRTSVDLEPDV